MAYSQICLKCLLYNANSELFFLGLKNKVTALRIFFTFNVFIILFIPSFHNNNLEEKHLGLSPYYKTDLKYC